MLRSLPVVLLLAVFLGSAAESKSPRVSSSGTGASLTQDLDRTTDEILRERLALLEELVALEQASYEQGVGKLPKVIAAKLDVLEARLELAADRAERIEIRKEMLDSAGSLADVVKAHYESGQTTHADVLRTECVVLRAEADLAAEAAAANR